MIQVDGVLDIETARWDQFVLGGLMRPDESYVDYDWRRADQLVDDLLAAGGHWWTWNGGLFDTLWVAQRLRRRGYRATARLAGTRIVELQCEGLYIHDGIALVPMRLAKAARIANIELVKDTGLRCECGDDCGGYCAIRRSLECVLTLRRYLRLDCLAVLRVLRAIIAEADRCGYELAHTVGSTSYRTAAALCGIGKAEWDDWRNYMFARRGYLGGRVEVYRPVADRGYSYDINSAYPAALTRVPLPVGEYAPCRGDRAQRAYRRERPGIYLARVEVPAGMHVPPLPVRTPRERVVFPVGRFRGVWPLPELRYAESTGCTVLVDRALVWSDEQLILAPFMNHAWTCRERATREENPALAEWHKWVPNSCSGKTGESPEKERYVINPKDEEIRICECGARSKRRCRCRAWRPLDREGEVWAAPYWRIPTNGHVQWGAYFTGATRVQLHQQLVADGAGGRSAVYCDTDSVKATRPRTLDVGPGLGQWKNEGDFYQWRAIAAKVYRYQTEEGGWRVKGKGLPDLTAAEFELFAAGTPLERSRGVLGFRSAARGTRGFDADDRAGLFRRKKLTRRNRSDGLHYGGRILGRDGLTHPQVMREILQWERSS